MIVTGFNIMEKNIAKQIMNRLSMLNKPFNEVAEMIEKIEDIEERKQFRRGIGDIMARVYTNLEMPIILSYPELDPDNR